MNIIDIIKKAYNSLFHKNTRGIVGGDGWIIGRSDLFQYDTLTEK